MLQLKYRSTLLLLLVAVLAAGCQPASAPRDSVRSFVIAMDSEGRPVDPDALSRKRPMSPEDYGQQLKQIFRAMDNFHAGQPTTQPADSSEPARRVLIFVHGGLNDPLEARGAAAYDFQRMKDANTGIYPIFIDWDCGLNSSYGQHLIEVRNGRVVPRDNHLSRALWPLYLLADLGRAAARAPLVWGNQLSEDAQTIGADMAALSTPGGDVSAAWKLRASRAQTLSVYEELLARYRAHPDRALHVSLGASHVTRGALVGLGAAYVITIPTKFIFSPLLDALGKAAWDNMTRRTLMLYEGPEASNPRRQKSTSSSLMHEPGALLIFLQELRAHINRNVRMGHRYDVTLVGHSMGTMVLNEFLRRDRVLEQQQQLGFQQLQIGPAATTRPVAPDGESRHAAPLFSYSNIVYMAAACTVRDFQESVVPYLRNHTTTKFYNLTLHPTADLRERNALDIPPRGSLLVWIDDYFAEPRTPLDVTLGRWDNIIEATWVIPPQEQARVTIKAFDLRTTDDNRDYSPQKHGHFRNQPYWEPKLWEAEP